MSNKYEQMKVFYTVYQKHGYNKLTKQLQIVLTEITKKSNLLKQNKTKIDHVLKRVNYEKSNICQS